MMLTQMNPYLNQSGLPKLESVDDEIEEYAKKIKMANEKKMAQIKSIPLMKPNLIMAPSYQKKEILSLDWTSVQGQFGWEELGEIVIPYIIRSGEKYISERMGDVKLFNEYKQIFTDEILQCFTVKKVKMTKAEAQLLNEINFRHCDSFYGSIVFTVEDYILTLAEVTEIYNFFQFCYNKLIKKQELTDKRCGFIRIGAENCVPYVCVEEKQYAPLFYFEGECKYLEDRSINLRGWDLAYLKIACLVQGIRKSLYDNETVQVVEVDLVKKFFIAGTLFEEFWLTNNQIDSLLKKTVVEISSDTRTNITKSASLQMNQPKKTIVCYEKKSIAKQGKKAIPSTLPNTTPIKDPVVSAYTGIPPATIPVTQNNRQYTNRQNTGQFTQSIGSRGTLGTNQTNSNFRPPTTSVTNSTYCNSVTTNTNTSASLSAAGQVNSLNSTNGANGFGSRFYIIPEVHCDSDTPYFLKRIQIEDKLLQGCINLEPYNPTILLVAIEEIALSVFCAPLEVVQNAINVMSLDIYIPNKKQMRTLHLFGLYNTKGLIKVNSFAENMRRIKYILQST